LERSPLESKNFSEPGLYRHWRLHIDLAHAHGKMPAMRYLPIFLLGCLFTTPSAHADEMTLSIGQHSIRAEIANTRQTRQQGLMRRTELCDACGMLFVYPAAGQRQFWMKNTPLPLSIAFIAENGSILNIVDMQPETTDAHNSAGKARYALEMNRGWFAAHGIRPGAMVLGVAAAPAARE